MSENNPEADLHERIQIDDQLALEALKLEDAKCLFDLVMQNQAYLARFLPWAEKYQSVDDATAFIELMLQRRVVQEEYGFGIVETGQLAGHAGLMHLRDGLLPEIGLWVAESSSGKGIGTKTASVLTDFGFNDLGLERILIRARGNNKGSNTIAQKLKYKFAGQHLDDEGIYLNHWIKRNPNLLK